MGEYTREQLVENDIITQLCAIYHTAIVCEYALEFRYIETHTHTYTPQEAWRKTITHATNLDNCIAFMILP